MLRWLIRASSILIVVTFSSECHGQSTGSNVPNDPLWSLFTELLSAQTGRTVQDLNALGLDDPTINTMWTAYKSSMPNIDTSSQQATSAGPDLYQPSYTYSSQSTSQPSSASGGGDMTQQLLSMLGMNSNSGSSSGTTSGQDLMKAYQNIMSSGGSGQAPMSQLMTASPMSTSTSTAPSYTDLLQQYQTIMGQGNAGQMSSSQSPSLSTANSPSSVNQMMNAYNQIMGAPTGSGTTSASSPVNNIMDTYTQMMSGLSGGSSGGTASPSSPVNQLMSAYSQLMGGQTSGGGNSMLNQLMSSYQNMMGGTSTATSNTQTAAVPSTSVDVVGSASVDGTPANTIASSQQPPATPTLSTFDQQLVQLFPQFKNVMQPPSSSSSPTVTQAPPVATITMPSPSTNSSNPQNTSDISSTNSAQEVFNVLLFGQGGQPSSQTADLGASTSSSNNQAGLKTPLEQYMIEKQKKSPGKILSQHMENVWKARAARDIGCRFLPELLELDIFPGVPIDCRNKCPFPYINAQRFGVYCMCCPPGVNDQIVSTMSLIRRPAFLQDNPMRVVT